MKKYLVYTTLRETRISNLVYEVEAESEDEARENYQGFPIVEEDYRNWYDRDEETVDYVEEKEMGDVKN